MNQPHQPMTAAEFRAGIRDAIRAAFMDDENGIDDGGFTTIRGTGDDSYLFIEGEINLGALADAVHEFVVQALSPPF